MDEKNLINTEIRLFYDNLKLRIWICRNLKTVLNCRKNKFR